MFPCKALISGLDLSELGYQTISDASFGADEEIEVSEPDKFQSLLPGDSFLRSTLLAVSLSMERKASYPSSVRCFFTAVNLLKFLFEPSSDRNSPRMKMRSTIASLWPMEG